MPAGKLSRSTPTRVNSASSSSNRRSSVMRFTNRNTVSLLSRRRRKSDALMSDRSSRSMTVSHLASVAGPACRISECVCDATGACTSTIYGCGRCNHMLHLQVTLGAFMLPSRLVRDRRPVGAAHLSSLYDQAWRHALGLWSTACRAGPDIVCTVQVDETVVGVELDLAQRLAAVVVLADVARRVRAPHLGGIVVLLRRAVAEGEQSMDRQDAARPIAVRDDHVLHVALLLRHDGVDRLVEVRILDEPLAPEIVEPPATRILHRAEEVRRRRMLVRPALDVRAEGVVERLGAHDLLSQQLQANARLHVRRESEDARIDA